jgi:PAS domain S-box-containing protein
MKILYVEDNPRDADLTTRHLVKTAPHFQLEAVSTLGEALARLERLDTEPLDLVLTDVHLPDGDGLALLTQIRDRALALAVVVITGTGDEETAVAALKTGADDYVTKRKGYLERLSLMLESALHHYRASAARHARPLRVLYAEHDPKDVDFTRRHFSKHAGHVHIDVVSTGPEALQRLQSTGGDDDYDVLLLDYRLPGLDALELLKELRLIQKLDIPVVLVTGQGSEEVALQAIKLGASSYVVKNPGYLYKLPVELENAHVHAELTRREEALRESEGRRRMAQQAARVGTWEWDVPTGESVWSEMIWELVGLEPDGGATTVERFIEFIHPEDRDRAVRKVNEVIADGEEYYDEFRLVRRDGGVLWVSSKGRLIRSASGQPERMLGVNIDITERKRAEEALKENENQVRLFVEHTPVAVAMFDREMRYMLTSRRWLKDNNLGEQDIIGRSHYDVVPDIPERWREGHRRCLAGAVESGKEDIFMRPDGSFDWVRWEIRPWYAAGGEIGGIIMFSEMITERKQAAEALRASEERFAKAFNSNPQPMSLTTLDEGRYIDVNESFLEMSGYTRDEVIGRTSLELDIWEMPADRAAFVRRLEEQGAIHNTEAKFRTKGGAFRVLLSSAELMEADGWRCLLVASSDITERKKVEQAVRFQAHLLNTIEQAVIATDMRGVVIFWNQFAERLYGWSMDEATGHAVKDLLKYENANNQAEEIWSQLRKGQSWAGEFTLKRRDGVTLQVWVNNSPIYDGRGNVIGVLGISYDITERKQAEEALRESEKRFRMMADATPIMIWMSGTNKLCTYFNKGWLDFTGRTMEEEMGHGWCEGVHVEDCDRCLETYRTSFNARQPFTMEYRLRRYDGEYRWLLDKGVPHYSPGGTFLGYIGSCLDITERKHAEEELLRLTVRLFNLQDEERRRIARELHDETAQNLFAITFNLARLQQHAATQDAEMQQLVADTITLGDESLREIRTLSYLLHPPLLDQAGLVSALRWYVEGFIKRSGIYVDLISLQQIGRLPSEAETALFRIVQESLTNIRRHSGGTTASVRLEKKKNGDIVLQVKDDGHGMTLGDSLNPADDIQGLGVGILGMRQRMRQLGGRLEVASGEEGTTITAIMPFKEGDDRDTHPTS